MRKLTVFFTAAITAMTAFATPASAFWTPPEDLSAAELETNRILVNDRSIYIATGDTVKSNEMWYQKQSNEIHVVLNNTEAVDDINQTFEAYNKEHGTNYKLQETLIGDYYKLCDWNALESGYQPDELYEIQNILPETAKELKQILDSSSEYIESATFHDKLYFSRFVDCGDWLFKYQEGEEADKVQAYLEQAGYEYKFITDERIEVPQTDFVYLKLGVPEDMTINEFLKLRDEIKENTGFLPGGAWGEWSESDSATVDLGYIDLLSYTEGDANCDGEAKIGDAVAVLQSIALPDKYALTEQGKFNADIDCNGITASDAITIQKMDAGIQQ